MTGIERLRVIGRCYAEDDDVTARAHGYVLTSITDQIERELREERDRWDEELCEAQMDKTRVMAVYLEMNKHVLGHEGAEDSPVARWARELREALGGEGHDHADEREAIAWVRDHGGLDHVREEWRSRVPYDRYERRRQRLLGHIAECERALGRRRRSIEALEGRVKAITNERDELRKRAMPEGYEWPRFEDGEPVRIGDEFAERIYGNPCKVGHFAINKHAFLIFDEEDVNDCEAIDHGTHKRVKRPEPKVLDADGAEVEVGDDLYSVEGMLKFHVSAIDKKSGRIATEAMFALDKWADPKMYTHRAPVLAADGKPLREGETVYHVADGRACVVREVRENGAVVEPVDGRPCGRCRADYLTHERPDSYDALWEDIEECAVGYESFMRRVKALAGGDAK